MSVTWQNMHIAHASIDTIWYYLIPYMRSTSSPACASQLENRIPMNGSIISIKLASTPLHPSSSKRGQLVTEHSHIPHSLPILFQVYSHDIPMNIHRVLTMADMEKPRLADLPPYPRHSVAASFRPMASEEGRYLMTFAMMPRACQAVEVLFV